MIENTRYPLISVLLPVYNGGKFLREAIESILVQTYKNFEMIIINDGSKDNSEEIIKSFKDERIHYYYQENQGLAAALNQAIAYSNGVYLARQDQDDISIPDRFKKQVDFLEKNPEYGIVGTWGEIIVNEGIKTGRFHKHPPDNLTLQFDLLFDNPFLHSSVMIRKSILQFVGIYTIEKDRQPPEDYELWSRIARIYSVANIPEVLVIYREIQNSMSRTGVNPFIEKVIKFNRENLAFYSKFDLNNPILTITAEFAHPDLYYHLDNFQLRSNLFPIIKLLYIVSERMNIYHESTVKKPGFKILMFKKIIRLTYYYMIYRFKRLLKYIKIIH